MDLKTTVDSVAEVGGIIGVRTPYNRVDTHLIFASAAGADTADVHSPAEHPAVVDWPIVTQFNTPCSVEGAAYQLREVLCGQVIVDLLFVVARVLGIMCDGPAILAGMVVSRRYGSLIVGVG